MTTPTNSVPDAFDRIGVQLLLLGLGWASLALLLVAMPAAVIGFVFDIEDFLLAAILAGVAFVVTGAFWLAVMVPFESRYYYDYRVEGHVTQVSNVLTEADGDLTRQPVIRLDSVDRPLVIDDPRAVDLKDKDVTLRCSIGWNYRAADTYSCKIIDFGSAS